MTGKMKVTYVVVCESDTEKTISGKDILSDEKILKAIKSAFGDGGRNVELTSLHEDLFTIKTARTEYSIEIEKDDFADALTLAEEDARRNKRIKKSCEQIMLIDIETIQQESVKAR